MVKLAKCIALSVLLIFFRLAEARLGENGRDESTFTEVIETGLDLERELKHGHHFTKPDKDLVRVMVGFKDNKGLEQVRGTAATWVQNMKNLRISTFLVTRENLKLLVRNPNIVFVEEDGMMTQDSESIPFGISVTKGDSTIIPASRGSPSACSNPDSFKVAIIDSGVDVGHPDIPCLPIDDPYTNCKGVSIGIDGQSWYAPKGKAGHGTHAFGTIGAIGGNGEGVAGMVPNSDGICYLIGRVFDDEGNGQYASNVFEAIDWAISEKADVINISSSGPAMHVTGQLSFYMAYANGDLTVASAGNRGSDAPQYPASFDHVLSVAAVKDDGERAYFSQYNDKVDVAAPGVDILSTTFHGRYATTSGTSMAAPYITGAIAKVWSICGDCSNIQVRECLLTTASSSSDRTNELGFSIVSADKTYDCLVNIVGCCGEDVSTGAIVDPRVEQLPAQGIDPELSWETLATTGCTRRAAVVKNASAVEEWESVRR